MMFKNKKIVVGISGGIAAYKSVILIRLLIKAGADVKVIVTSNALEFITPLTLETISRNPLYNDMFRNEQLHKTAHISLTDWADIFIVAPATANIIGKYANGIADDALSTSLLAFDKPLFIAPSMNSKMYSNFSVRKNLDFLKQQGVHIIEPTDGELACEWDGKGRMEDPENIIKIVAQTIKKKEQFNGKKILVTAGPTYEQIDPVRFISNHSSGLMGFAIAREFADRGGQVTLISGPTNLNANHPAIKKTDIVSAQQMYNVCISTQSDFDIIVMSAAVADFTPVTVVGMKIKKEDQLSQIKLKPTKDILAEMGKKKHKGQFIVGFALETTNELEHAKKKLHTKNLDLIVINSLNDKGAGFGLKTNKITIMDRAGKLMFFELKQKELVAIDIIDTIYSYAK